MCGVSARTFFEVAIQRAYVLARISRLHEMRQFASVRCFARVSRLRRKTQFHTNSSLIAVSRSRCLDQTDGLRVRSFASVKWPHSPQSAGKGDDIQEFRAQNTRLQLLFKLAFYAQWSLVSLANLDCFDFCFCFRRICSPLAF